MKSEVQILEPYVVARLEERSAASVELPVVCGRGSRGRRAAERARARAQAHLLAQLRDAAESKSAVARLAAGPRPVDGALSD